jgi:hypothetical protein
MLLSKITVEHSFHLQAGVALSISFEKERKVKNFPFLKRKESKKLSFPKRKES